MSTTKMTIHRALTELKLIDAKIEKQISEVVPSGISQKGKLISGHITKEDFEKNAKSKYDSVNDLIKRRLDIKSAIVKANGATEVEINKKKMMIADAINFKAIIGFKKQLVDALKARHNHSIAQLNKSNEVVENNMQSILEATFGKESVKAGKDDMESVRKPYMEANEFHLFDPLKAQERIEEIEKEVGEFEAEVDAVLSEINAVTIIEI